MKGAAAGIACALLVCAAIGAGCRSRPSASRQSVPVSIDVRIIRFPPESYDRFTRAWAYADARTLPSKKRNAWKEKRLGIGKIAREHEQRVGEILEHAGAEIKVRRLEGIPSGTAVPLVAGGRIPMPSGEMTLLLFRVIPRLAGGRRIEFEISPAIVDAGSRRSISALENLTVSFSCARGESLLIGPEAADGEGLAAYLGSREREGWIQAFWVMVPMEQSDSPAP